MKWVLNTTSEGDPAAGIHIGKGQGSHKIPPHNRIYAISVNAEMALQLLQELIVFLLQRNLYQYFQDGFSCGEFVAGLPARYWNLDENSA